MEVTREEQETNVVTNAASREWDFWTFDPRFVRRLTKLGWELKKDHQGDWSCKIPRDRIKIMRPEKRKTRLCTIPKAAF
ncbi:MAG: hypothetical protein LAP85_28030 [Acidobacteriia bacterium]|nr:hypothetical protein [Terriglobia bacterium]